MKKVFAQFGVKDTINWFESRNVPLITQSDNCIFPKSQNSQTIIDCFRQECKDLNIEIKTGYHLKSFTQKDEAFEMVFNDSVEQADKVILTIGGQPKISGFALLKATGHSIVEPLPSLFTFNMPHESIRNLKGIVVDPVMARIQGAKLVEEGPLLITHWGMSGPAILKLSAWGARLLAGKKYQFNVQVNWMHNLNFEEVKQLLMEQVHIHGQKKIANQKIVRLPTRLWQYLIHKIDFDLSKKWCDLSKHEFNKLANILINDIYTVEGKTTFKEEFVTAGGVTLSEINFNTMESKIIKGLYFAGEGIDIDGITGGFNFQAAWSTGYVAAQLN